MREEDVAALGL